MSACRRRDTRIFWSERIRGLNKGRLSELKDIMNDYMTAKTGARVFGDDGCITRTMQERTSFDMEKMAPLFGGNRQME